MPAGRSSFARSPLYCLGVGIGVHGKHRSLLPIRALPSVRLTSVLKPGVDLLTRSHFHYRFKQQVLTTHSQWLTHTSRPGKRDCHSVSLFI